MFRAILVFLAIATAYADVEDHFKPITDKSDIHKMRNIDFIYMINLDERPEKYNACIDRLAPFGIHPYRFSAVNGWQLTLEAINDVGVKYETWMTGVMGTRYLLGGDKEPHHEYIEEPGVTYFSHCMSRGAIGIVLSHLSILQDAWDSGYETIWVMEDDVVPIQDPNLLSELIDRLDALVGEGGWDIFFTDQDTKNNYGMYVPCTGFGKRPNFHPHNEARFEERTNLSDDFRKIGARFGAYSMIVRRSGMKKILEFLKSHQVFLPYDIEFPLPNGIRLFSVTEDIVSTQPGAISDNGAPNYIKN